MNLPAFASRGLRVPQYRRAEVRSRIVHIGVGGFHRSHMALYTDDLAHRGSEWRICGLGILPNDRQMASALAAQDHLYTVIERHDDTAVATIVGSVTEFCLADHDLSVGAHRIADPTIEIVSLTITEGGYAVAADGTPPRAIDMIVDALELRRFAGCPGVTVLSCDNLPGNGDVAREAVRNAAALRSSGIAQWIDEQCTFPNSMVDRITPMTADSDREWLRAAYGVDDRWPVVGEAFRQWVIEDNFAQTRPAWELAGALFTDDVHAWELYKLRMLNAAHSNMAYLCHLAEIEFVDEGLADPIVRNYLERFLANEAIPTLTPIPGFPCEDYAKSVLERFSNTGVRDQIARLCQSGTAKYPIFLIPTLHAQLEAGGPIGDATLALAAWARYLAIVPAEHQAMDISGDAARAFAIKAVGDPLAFLDFAEVFPANIRDHPRFRDEFATTAANLAENGPRAAMLG